MFVGYGVQDATLGYDDYRGLDVKGKIVVALVGPMKGIDSEVAAHLGNVRLRAAARLGAVGVIFIPTRAFSAVAPWERLLEGLTVPATTWVRKDGTPFTANPGVQAGALVQPAAAAALFAGEGRSLADILDEADREDGRPAGFAMRSTAHMTAATTVRRYASPQVVGVIEGADPALADEYVAMTAHADHIGLKADATGDAINNGALDNAAGIAVLLEVARPLATSAERPRRSILLIAHTAEEQGLLGAEYFVHHQPVPIERVTAAVNLDMPMLLYDFTDVIAFGAQHSTIAPVLARTAASMGLTLSPDPMPQEAIFVRSDHYAMVKAGVPAVMLSPGMANGGEAAWGMFLGTHYHQPSDDTTLPIDWNAGAKFAHLNYRLLEALADDAQRARWYAHDYFGDLFAPGAPKAAR